MNDTLAPTGLSRALLGFERVLQRCRSRRELQFALVNEAFTLLQYDQAVLGEPGLAGRAGLTAVSGLAEVDANSPFAQWFARLAQWLAQQPGKILALTPGA